MRSICLNEGVRRAGILVAVTPLAIIGFCGEVAAHFELENRTDQPLYAWAFYENCEESPGYRQDYFLEKVVPMGETLRYSYDSPGAPDAIECIQVADSQRRLVLSEPYEIGARYVLTDATPIDQKRVPPIDELPSQPWLDLQEEDFLEDPAGYIVSAVIIVGLLTLLLVGLVGAMAYGMVHVTRHLQSRSQSGGT